MENQKKRRKPRRKLRKPRMTPLQHAQFNKWVKSDNVIKRENGLYSCQCNQYMLQMTLKRLKKYYKWEYILD